MWSFSLSMWSFPEFYKSHWVSWPWAGAGVAGHSHYARFESSDVPVSHRVLNVLHGFDFYPPPSLPDEPLPNFFGGCPSPEALPLLQFILNRNVRREIGVGRI